MLPAAMRHPTLGRELTAALFATYTVRMQTNRGTTTLTFDTLAKFFTLPSTRAAEEIGISSRTLIRVCRSLGIRRWPFLSFRSENNIQRIRGEAICALARYLSKKGINAPPAGTLLYPNTLLKQSGAASSPTSFHSSDGSGLQICSPLTSFKDLFTSSGSDGGLSDCSLPDTSRLVLQTRPRAMSMQDILASALAATT